MNNVAISFIVVAVLLVIALFMGRRSIANNSPMPKYLGVTDGRLATCPDSPNCVSTQADPTDEEHHITPISLPISTDGEATAAREALVAAIQAMPGATIVANEPNYIHAEFRSRLWGFVDDMEFYFDRAEGVIHNRTGARLGYSDIGANRKLYEAVRTEVE